MSDFYKKSTQEIVKELDTSSEFGLKDLEVSTRLKKYGLNEIQHEKKISPIKIFFRQFVNPLVYILLVAVGISILVNEMIDAIVIFAIVILNSILGFTQEYKAEKALELLKKMAAPHARVIRNGHIKIVDTTTLVPGDILVLESGDKVPSDARLIEIASLRVNEAVLTGESNPVSKELNPIAKQVSLADQKNMVFAGTIIAYGRGKAVVTSTGNNTEFGKIASSIELIQEQTTPLQKNLNLLGKKLSIIAVGIIALVFVLALLIDHLTFTEALLTAISLAVAAIPEGLPAVVTIALAIGVKRLVKNKALIRKLAAVETLGSVNVVCSDKTGTMTSGEMTVRAVFANNDIIKVTGNGYAIEGTFMSKGQLYPSKKIEKLLEIALLCNNSDLKDNQGDPTELALKVVAAKGKLRSDFKRVDEIPFDSNKKYMATIDVKGKEKYLHLKGAPEIVLNMCTRFYDGNRIRTLTEKEKKKILDINNDMAANALRVLGFAFSEEGSMKNLTFMGLIGMMDPPRESVVDAVKIAKRAGIRIIMITGDNAITAKAIAHQVGIKSEVVTGQELDLMNDEAILNTTRQVSVYARVNPEHKVKILEALQKDKNIVAMTGDGINDAPALKQAHIGIAMGISGTDVSKESSDMILLDDHFSTIVKAVEYGRSIYDNIKKFIKYLLSANLGEVAIILFSLLFRLPLPFLPLQLLWLNLVTDGLPALALGSDPAEKDVMTRKPRPSKETILDGTKGFIILTTIISTVIVLGLFSLEYLQTGDLNKSRTIALSTLIFFELLLAFSVRSETKTIFQIGLFTNKYLVYAVLSSALLNVILIYTSLGNIFGLVPLELIDWVYITGAALFGVSILEIRKLFIRRNVQFTHKR